MPVPSTFRTVSGLVPNPIRPCVALVGVLAAWCLSASSPAAPPNIVVLVADDLGWNDVSLHGAEIPTPNIDRIANEGVELERFYVNPVCSPTRVALMSGKHPIRYGLQRVTIKAWTELGIPPSEETLPELLARGGYDRRGVFGKWHLGRHRRFHPLEQGFTEFVGHLGGAIDYFTHESLGRLDWHRGFALDREEGYSTRLIGKHAVRFIDASASAEPFFLYVPFNAVHTPNHVLDEHMRRNAAIRPENRRLKAAMTTSMDDEIGNILAALDDRGLAANTLVLFFSDNGGVPPAGSSNEPLRGRKHTLYEGGIRVVAAVRWPDGGSPRRAPLSMSCPHWRRQPELRRGTPPSWTAGMSSTCGAPSAPSARTSSTTVISTASTSKATWTGRTPSASRARSRTPASGS